MREHLEKLAAHLEKLDSGSIDAKAIRWILEWQSQAKRAADGILAPMTMEFGRIMEEAPDQLVELTLCSCEAQIAGRKFMDLYHATDL